jgi:hypothetical protein
MAKPYIATAPLFVGFARAFNPGDVVPDEHVEKYGWQDGVSREGTKAAETAQAEPTPAAGPPPK